MSGTISTPELAQSRASSRTRLDAASNRAMQSCNSRSTSSLDVRLAGSSTRIAQYRRVWIRASIDERLMECRSWLTDSAQKVRYRSTMGPPFSAGAHVRSVVGQQVQSVAKRLVVCDVRQKIWEHRPSLPGQRQAQNPRDRTAIGGSPMRRPRRARMQRLSSSALLPPSHRVAEIRRP